MCFQASFLLGIMYLPLDIFWFFFTSLLLLLPLWKETYLFVKESGQSAFAHPETGFQWCELPRCHCHCMKQTSILNHQRRESQSPVGRVKAFQFAWQNPSLCLWSCIIDGAAFYSAWMINVPSSCLEQFSEILVWWNGLERQQGANG